MSNEPSIEAMFASVEVILKQLESGELTLEESLARYEEAQHLLVNCGQALQVVEEKVAFFDEKTATLRAIESDQLRQ